MKDKLLKIINHYGVEPQQRKLEEEVFELQKAIIEYNEPRRFKTKDHIAEEMADVMVLLHQIRFYYDLEDEEVARIFTEKINRQIERIENE